MNERVNTLLAELASSDATVYEMAAYHLMILVEFNTRILLGCDPEKECERYAEYFEDEGFLRVRLESEDQREIMHAVAEMLRSDLFRKKACGLLSVMCAAHPLAGMPVILDLLERIDEIGDHHCYYQVMSIFQHYISIDKDNPMNLAMKDLVRSKNPTWFWGKVLATKDERLCKYAEVTRSFLEAIL